MHPAGFTEHAVSTLCTGDEKNIKAYARFCVPATAPHSRCFFQLVSTRKRAAHFFFAKRNKNMVIQCFDFLASFFLKEEA
jgi:hypothetical protein